MALSISDLWTRLTKSALKASLITIAKASGLPADDFVAGDPSERWLEIIPRVLDQVLGTIVLQAVQAFFLDQATDPGDPGNPSATIAAGWLSQLGEAWYGVVRRGQTFATGTITITNNNAYTIYPKPGEIVAQRSIAAADGGFPTYTTSEDDSIYTNPDGSVTIAPSASVDVPIVADVIGSYSNAASSGLVTVLITGTFGTLACTNASPVLGEERESAEVYRARCRRAPARVASGAPTASYEYAANTTVNGDPLQRHDGSGPVGIVKVFVDDAITEAGSVTVYCADDVGAADTTDVDSANANITGIPLGSVTETIGVVPGSVDYDTVPAIEHSVHVVGTAKVKAADAGGLTSLELQTKITEALAAYFQVFPIGGLDQVIGAGKLYTSDMIGIARDSWPGLYAVVITTPAGASTNLALGEVATLASDPSSDWAVAIT